MKPATNTTAGIKNAVSGPRTACSICHCSIFIGDETAWVVTPNPGLAHKLCAEEGTPRSC